jgi:hypothetical protein
MTKERRRPKIFDPKDAGPPESTLGPTLTGSCFLLGELGLGEFTPSKFDRVAIVKSFLFDKDKGIIVR